MTPFRDLPLETLVQAHGEAMRRPGRFPVIGYYLWKEIEHRGGPLDVRTPVLSKPVVDALIAALTEGDPWDDPDVMEAVNEDDDRMRRP